MIITGLLDEMINRIHGQKREHIKNGLKHAIFSDSTDSTKESDKNTNKIASELT
jgi:hypothetical protein